MTKHDFYSAEKLVQRSVGDGGYHNEERSGNLLGFGGILAPSPEKRGRKVRGLHPSDMHVKY